MKTWECTFWRENPQLSNGGYKTARTVEANTKASAEKKAEKKYGGPSYGGMILLNVVEKKL